MKPARPASIAATFVSAVLSLILPTSAMSTEEAAQPYRDPAPVHGRSNERAWIDPFHDDPVLKSPWGPGDPNLAVQKFHFGLSHSPEHRSGDRDSWGSGLKSARDR